MKKTGFFLIWMLLGVMFASCASSSPKHSFGPYSDAENFYKKGNYPKAIEKYQEYLTVNPRGNLAAIAEYFIAKSYVASRDTLKARDGFKRVMERFPGTSWAEFSKEQLKTLNGTAEA